MDINKIISIIRTLKEDGGTVVGTGGFTSAAAPAGPVAGYDKVMKFDGRSKIARRLPPPYKSALINSKKTKKEK